jgi:hypothetical protein
MVSRIVRVDEVSGVKLAAQRVRDGERQARRAPDHALRRLSRHRQVEREQQAQGRVVVVQARQEQSPDHDPDQRYAHERQRHGTEEAETLLDWPGRRPQRSNAPCPRLTTPPKLKISNNPSDRVM